MASTLLEGHKVSHLRDSLYYIPNYLSGDEADALWRHIYAAPKPKWTVLKNRRLQNWGGVLSEKGLCMYGEVQVCN
jgi:alkylated DNA repair protein alkB family protein 6